MLTYIGTYTRRTSEGVYVCRFDPSRGTLGDMRLAARLRNPTFLASDRARRCLYVGHDVEGGQDGMVSAFAIDAATGDLTPLSRSATHGWSPCHVSVDATARCVVVANYQSEGGGAGCVAVFAVGRDGALGEATAVLRHEGSSADARRQAGPHPHSANMDPTNRYVLVPDLGIDQVVVYRLGAATAALRRASAAPVEAGSGPRHMAFDPSGRRAYLISELGNTVMAFAWDAAAGELRHLQTLPTLPAGFTGQSACADVHVHPSGRFVYGSNRGHDSIAIYAVDAATGRLTALGQEPTGGRNPRNFAIDPSGTYLLAANQDTDNIVSFRIDAGTGRLALTGQAAQASMPVCVLMLPAPGEG